MYRRNWTKYNSRITVIDWISFKSLLESSFYQYFKNHKKIKLLWLQPSFILQEKFKYNWKIIREIKYIADFKIELNWRVYIVDSKWFKDKIYLLKKKLFLYKYGKEFELLEVNSIRWLELIIF